MIKKNNINNITQGHDGGENLRASGDKAGDIEAGD